MQIGLTAINQKLCRGNDDDREFGQFLLMTTAHKYGFGDLVIDRSGALTGNGIAGNYKILAELNQTQKHTSTNTHTQMHNKHTHTNTNTYTHTKHTHTYTHKSHTSVIEL